jgi:hypothetical protein
MSNDEDRQELIRIGVRATAEVLEASPAELEERSPDHHARRLWTLRVRVQPPDAPSFEASVDHAFRATPGLDSAIEPGSFAKLLPLGRQKVQVAYDPNNPERLVVCPPTDSDQGGRAGIRLAGIVGRNLPPQRDFE